MASSSSSSSSSSSAPVVTVGGKGSSLSSSAMAIRAAGKSSLGRAASVVGSMGDLSLRSRVSEAFEKNCPSWCRQKLLLKVMTLKLCMQHMSCCVSCVKSWAALPLFAIDKDESLEEKTQIGPSSTIEANGGDTKADKKKRKKKDSREGNLCDTPTAYAYICR